MVVYGEKITYEYDSQNNMIVNFCHQGDQVLFRHGEVTIYKYYRR